MVRRLSEPPSGYSVGRIVDSLVGTRRLAPWDIARARMIGGRWLGMSSAQRSTAKPRLFRACTDVRTSARVV
jgi:hypothetical protein